MRHSLVAFLFLLASPLIAQINTKQHVAILSFSSNSKDISEENLNALTERFETELIKTESYTVLERRDVNLVLQEQGFQHSGACDQSECQVEIGKILGVEKMIMGTVSKVDNLYSMNLKKVDVESGKLEYSHALDIKGDFQLLLTGGCYEMAQIFSGKKQPESSHTVLEASSNSMWWWLGTGVVLTGAVVTTLILLQEEDAPQDREVMPADFSVEAP